MSENKELNEDMLDDVTGGMMITSTLQPMPELEKPVLKDAMKKIEASVKAGRAVKDAGNKKIAHL